MKRLILIATMALCSMPTIESSFFARHAGTAFQAIKNNKLNGLIAGLCAYPIFTENANAQQNIALAQELVQLKNSSVSKTQLAILTTAALCVGGYIWINHKYKQFLANQSTTATTTSEKAVARPTINAILTATKTTQEAVTEFMTTCILAQHVKGKDIQAIIKLLA